MRARCVALYDRPSPRKPSINTSIQIGKYLVSPLTRRLPDDRYAASVSIRSGTGSGTHDRVLRLVPLFRDPCEAIHYAMGQGIAWLNERGNPQPRQETPWPRKN